MSDEDLAVIERRLAARYWNCGTKALLADMYAVVLALRLERRKPPVVERDRGAAAQRKAG